MGIQEDLERFQDVGEKHREDLSEYIRHGEIKAGEGIKIPIKIIDLPSFEYDQLDMGGIGQGEGDVGDPVEDPSQGDEPGKPGEDSAEHGHYEMDPEEFAEELDEELGLDLEPKGKKIKEITEGAMVDLVRSGPDSTLDFERMWKKGLKRSLATYFDEDYLREVLRVEGFGPQTAFEWAREENIQVSKKWLEHEYNEIPPNERSKYETVDDIEREYQNKPQLRDIESVPLREEDKRHKYPEITKEYEKNAVVVFIRDVSGSMRKKKRELVERTFTPLDWYLTGKYDNAEFVYIAHDVSAEEVERDQFFGMKSSGGTRISSAYELADKILEEQYSWSDWNRYVFAAGDGENSSRDTEKVVVPLMEKIEANLHAYLQVQPDDVPSGFAEHGETVESMLGDQNNVSVAYASKEEDVLGCISEFLSTEDDSE